MRIFLKMYDILELLEQSVTESDAKMRETFLQKALGTEVYDDKKHIRTYDLFQLIFGKYPDDAESSRLSMVYSTLMDRHSLTTNSARIYAMESDRGEKVLFADTHLCRELFGDSDISQSKVDQLRREIGRAELALCKLGIEFCLDYHDFASYVHFWDRIIADNDKTAVRSLYLSNGALRQLAYHRITERQFNYLCRDLRYLSDKQLSRIKVRSGEIDPAAVIHWLYGEQEFSSETSDLILTAVQMACNNQGHNCWSELLHLEFGQDESSAAWILGGTAFDYPLDALQEKLRAAMWVVNENFLKLRNSAKRGRNQNRDTATLARPYSMP